MDFYHYLFISSECANEISLTSVNVKYVRLNHYHWLSFFRMYCNQCRNEFAVIDWYLPPNEIGRPRSQASDNGRIVFLRFWTFLGFENLGPSGCLGKTSIFKIIMSD